MTYVTALQVISRVGSNEFYARAVGSEEYDEAVELRSLALHVQTTLPGVAQPPMPATVDDDIGGWLDAVVAADAATGERERKHSALTALISQCEGIIAAAANLDPDRLLKSLSVELDALMEDVEAVVNRLGGARTPQEVIAAGVGDEYNKLGELRERYDQLRRAQDWTLGSDLSLTQSKFFDDPHANCARIRNLDMIFPAWRDGSTNRVVLSGVEPDPRPWPSDPVEFLFWLVTSEAEWWLPTRRQLEQLHAERARRLHPAPKVRHHRPDRPEPKQSHGMNIISF